MNFLSVDLVLRVTLLIAPVLILARIFGVRSAHLSHRLIVASLSVSLAAPLVLFVAPAWNVLPRWNETTSSPVAHQHTGRTNHSPAVEHAPDTRFQENGFEVVASSSVGSPVIPDQSNLVAVEQSVVQWPVVVWAIGFVAMLTPFVLGRFSLERRRRRSPLVKDESVLASLHHVSETLGWGGSMELRLCDQLTVPMCWGLRNPTILLPSTSLHWPKDRLRRVLLHEVGHLQRRDLWSDFVSHIVRACYWYHPLFWAARRQLHQLREIACDELVLASGSNPGDYAEDLLAISRAAESPSHPNLQQFMAISMADASGLSQRLHCVLDPKRRKSSSPSVRPNRVAVSLLLLFAAIVLVVGQRPLRAQTQVDVSETPNDSKKTVLSDEDFRLELVAIGCENDNQQWWTPTGLPLPRTPYENSRGGKAFADGRPVQFVLKEWNVDETDKLILSVDQARATQRQTAETLDGSPAQVFTAFMDEQADRCQMRILRSTGPWNDALTFHFQQNAAMTSGQIAISVSEPVGNDQQTTVYASIGLNAGDADYRVLAIDRKGETHLASSIRGGSAKGKRRAALSTIRFDGLRVQDFVGLKLQTRPYARYFISDIPIKANSDARPEVKLEAAPPNAKANLTWNTATLHHWEDQESKEHVLDLATGKMYRWESERDPVKQALIFMAQKRGDLMLADELMALRGTQVSCPTREDWEIVETVGGIQVYPQVRHQDQLLVTTPEGDQYVAIAFAKDDPNDRSLVLNYMRVEEEQN